MRLLALLFVVPSLAIVIACNSGPKAEETVPRESAADAAPTASSNDAGAEEQEAVAAQANSTRTAEPIDREERLDSDSGAPSADGWRALFDGESLDGWAVTSFGGEGEVRVEDGAVLLPYGSPLTGIHYEGELPEQSYEIALEATRVSGSDFFCGLTFPVGESHCTLVLGGWGGAWCGLSCIDGKDASNNDTGHPRSFESGRAYDVRVQVTPEHIRAWLDDEQIVDQSLAGHEVTIRPEVAPSRPLGVASFATSAAIRNIRLRDLGGRTATRSEDEDR